MNEQAETNGEGPDRLDDAIQREIDEALGGRSIEDLLDESVKIPEPTAPPEGDVQAGRIVPCRVAAIDRDVVLMEMGGKDQGYVRLEQFEENPAVGDIIQLEVVRYDRGEDMWLLSREGAVERATWEDLAEGTIVEAFVEKANKGGLEVRFGGVRGFMPVSHISLFRVEEPAEYVNQKIRCQVVEVDRRERRVIVSARALLELEAEKKKQALLAELAEGDVREGIVRQVMPYGAFVDIGGVDGLVHVSQMSYGRVEDPAALVQPGQKVQVQVLTIDRDNDRIALGMKQTQPDPWESAEVNYRPETLATGRVIKLEKFGAFVELEPGLEALIPISEISWVQHLKHPSEMLEVGRVVKAVVMQVDLERRRLSLSLRQAQANPWVGAEQKFPPHSQQAGRVSRIADFGAFVELEPGVEGLVHISELSDSHVRRVEEVVQVDQEVKVRVLEVDEPGRRVSLSMKGVLQVDYDAEAEPDRPKKKRKRPLRGGLD